MSAITAPRVTTPASPRTIADTAIEKLAAFLTRHSVAILRVSIGLVFVVFASFKYVSGASPAQDLAIATVDKLTLGMVTGHSALLFTALTETIIGITLLTGRFVKVGLCVMAMAMVGILSPLVLFPGQMWGDHGPTLTGQYVFKDLVLVAGAMVVAAHALGARLRRD